MSPPAAVLATPTARPSPARAFIGFSACQTLDCYRVSYCGHWAEERGIYSASPSGRSGGGDWQKRVEAGVAAEQIPRSASSSLAHKLDRAIPDRDSAGPLVPGLGPPGG